MIISAWMFVCPRRSVERPSDLPGTRVKNDCKPLCGCWDLNHWVISLASYFLFVHFVFICFSPCQKWVYAPRCSAQSSQKRALYWAIAYLKFVCDRSVTSGEQEYFNFFLPWNKKEKYTILFLIEPDQAIILYQYTHFFPQQKKDFNTL